MQGVYCILYFVSRVRCRRKESSRSLSHLLRWVSCLAFRSCRLARSTGGYHLIFNFVTVFCKKKNLNRCTPRNSLSYTPSHLLAENKLYRICLSFYQLGVLVCGLVDASSVRHLSPTPDAPFPRGGVRHNDKFVVYTWAYCATDELLTVTERARACAVYHHCSKLTFNSRFHVRVSVMSTERLGPF